MIKNDHNVGADSLLRECAKAVPKDEDLFAELGYKTFGPLLTGFTLWLRDQVKHDDIHDLYFMSRDGYMMKLAFEKLDLFDVRTHYLYCSRRAYTVPMLWKHPEFGDVFQNIAVPKTMTVRKLLIRLGQEPERWSGLAEECGLELDREYGGRTLQSDDKVQVFYEKIKPYVIENSKEEYEALLCYIRELKMDESIGVVDIGYFGTMQNALVQLIDEAGMNTTVNGYYVGVAADAPLVNDRIIKASGYLYERGKNETYKSKIDVFSAIYETIFLAHHGSVKRFKIQDDQVFPELYEYEYGRILRGGYSEDQVLESYQQGALAFLSEFLSLGNGCTMVSPESALRSFLRMAKYPTLSEAELWGDFSFLDVEYREVAKPKGLFTYMKRPRELIKDYKLSLWRVGFMRRLFKIPFPYYSVICLAKRILKKS